MSWGFQNTVYMYVTDCDFRLPVEAALAGVNTCMVVVSLFTVPSSMLTQIVSSLPGPSDTSYMIADKPT